MTTDYTFEQNINAFKDLVKSAPPRLSLIQVSENLICSKTDCINCILFDINCEFTQQTAEERLNFIAGVLTEKVVIL